MRPLTVALPAAVMLLATAAAVAAPAGLPDKGVYSQLDPQVSIALPVWAPAAELRLHLDRARGLMTVVRGGEPVKTYAVTFRCREPKLGCLNLRDADRDDLHALSAAPIDDGTTSPSWRDTDGDGIPDAVDVLLGGKKTVLLATPYVETARKLPYPGGDMPTNEGVCTDVVVRALRNAGIDLQKEVFEDAGRAPKAYPAIRSRNASIDHRRVRNLMVYLERHFRRVDPHEVLPGDIVLLDTFPDRKGIEHIGLVSDRLGRSGRPLIINAWTDGFVTSEMDLLGGVAAPAAYRVPGGSSPSPWPPGSFRLDAGVRQVVLAVSPSWASPSAEVSWWDRDRGGAWRRAHKAAPAMLGAKGMGWGRGLLPASLPGALSGPTKAEGDNRAPAGVFRLASATGYAPRAPTGVRLPYVTATADLRCVDDARSRHYNRLVPVSTAQPRAWNSDEAMLRTDGQYALTIVVDHNRDPVLPGAGSCIFLHPWPSPNVPSPGCTMLAPEEIERLLRWLDPASAPVLVQLPATIYRTVAATWDLPR